MARFLEAAMIPRILSALLILYMASPSRAQSLDLVIRNGSVLDGSGSPAQQVDIGIRGDRVVVIWKKPEAKG
jgi:N-acyl-D-amino-acid deacylase